MTVVELGTMLPVAGGWYVYSRRAMGAYAGSVVGCSDWMVQTVSVAYLAVAFGGVYGTVASPIGRPGETAWSGIARSTHAAQLDWPPLEKPDPGDHQHTESCRSGGVVSSIKTAAGRPATQSLAEVAELADAHGSPCTRKGVGVRVPSSTPGLPSRGIAIGHS